MEAAMPCKLKTFQHRETCGESNEIRKSKPACMVEGHESTRKRLERTPLKDHEDHIAEKGFNSLSHHNLVHKFILVHQAMKSLDAKAAVDKEWEKLEKLPAWQMTKVKNKREVILEAQKEQRTVHFATPMDICHLKNAELEPKYQKYKGRVVLRSDIVKDDSGSCAVFTKQGSSASQMTAATVMDVITRQPDCAGQGADAVSAFSQVKIVDAPKLPNVPKSECPDTWIRLPRNKWPKSWSNIEDPVVPLERNPYGRPLAGLWWERQFEKSSLGTGKGKYTELGMPLRHSKKSSIFSVYVDDIKMVGRKQNLSPLSKNLMKLEILENQHHFLTMCTWDVLNVNANRTRTSLKNF